MKHRNKLIIAAVAAVGLASWCAVGTVRAVRELQTRVEAARAQPNVATQAPPSDFMKMAFGFPQGGGGGGFGFPQGGGFDPAAAIGATSMQNSGSEMDWVEELDGPTVTADHVNCSTTGGTCVPGSSRRPGINVIAINSVNDTTRVQTNTISYTMPVSTASLTERVTPNTSNSICMLAMGVAIQTLSDATDRQLYTIGFADVTNADQTDGAYFFYDDSVSTKWNFKVAAAGVRSSVILDGVNTDTQDRTVAVGNINVIPATGEIDNFMVCCHTARCDAYMKRMGTGTDTTFIAVASACASGCSVPATNIPSAAIARAFGMFVQQFSTVSAGATRNMFVDAVGVRETFVPAR